MSPPRIVMDGQELAFSVSVKYFGMTIQSSLSWTTHVLGQMRKANMLLNRARAIIGGMVFRSRECSVDIYCHCQT